MDRSRAVLRARAPRTIGMCSLGMGRVHGKEPVLVGLGRAGEIALGLVVKCARSPGQSPPTPARVEHRRTRGKSVKQERLQRRSDDAPSASSLQPLFKINRSCGKEKERYRSISDKPLHRLLQEDFFI